jgi:hypothetical protein
MQQFQPFGRQRCGEESEAGDVAARPVQALHEAGARRIAAADEHVGGRGHGGPHRKMIADDHRHVPAHQVGRQRRQPIEIVVGIALLNRHVLALDKARLGQALAQRRHQMP